MVKLATEVRITGDRSTEQGKMLLDAISRFNKKLKDRQKKRERERYDTSN